MNTVCSPCFDPDFDSLPKRIYGPPCRVNIDNESLEDCTIIKIDNINEQGLLFISCQNEVGNKVTDQRVINYIQQAIDSNSGGMDWMHEDDRVIELTGKDRPDLFS